MSPEAEIVASLLRWSQQVIMVESLRGTSLPGPRAPGCPLGRLIKREDVATALAIVMDMNPDYVTDTAAETARMVAEAQAGDTTMVRTRVHTESNELAEKLHSTLARYYERPTREFMLVATRAISWKMLETVYPGRDWRSLRDDFEDLARQLWRSEKFFLSHVVDFVVKTT